MQIAYLEAIETTLRQAQQAAYVAHTRPNLVVVDQLRHVAQIDVHLHVARTTSSATRLAGRASAKTAIGVERGILAELAETADQLLHEVGHVGDVGRRRCGRCARVLMMRRQRFAAADATAAKEREERRRLRHRRTVAVPLGARATATARRRRRRRQRFARAA